MSDLAAVFPRRPLRLRQPRGLLGQIFWALVGIALIGGLAAWIGLHLAPDLLNDYRLRDSAVPLRDARLVEGRCRVRLAMVQDCTLTLALRTKDGEVTREVQYLFVEFSHGDRRVGQILGDPTRPETLTTDLGMDRLWNRVAMLAVVVVIGAFMALGMVLLALGARRQRRLVGTLSGQALTPLPARLIAHGPGKWMIQAEGGPAVEWEVPRRAKPFLLDPAGAWVLAVTAPGASAVFPLDHELRWIDLTPPERAALMPWRATP